MTKALVTGANRGVGLEFVKQLAEQSVEVFACCRQPAEAAELQTLAESNDQIHIHALDVNDQTQVDALAKQLADQPIDLLINNAGISGEKGVTVGNINRDNFRHVMETNCLSVVKVSEAFLPQVEKSQDKLIVVISSRMASISDNDRGQSYAYRASKAAVNAVMRSFAIDVKERGVHVLLLHPGWVRTDMGGPDGLIDAETSVKGLLKQVAAQKKTAHAEALHRYDGGMISW